MIILQIAPRFTKYFSKPRYYCKTIFPCEFDAFLKVLQTGYSSCFSRLNAKVLLTEAKLLQQTGF